MKEQERDILRRTILELLMNGNLHYTDLDKKYALPVTYLLQQIPSNLNYFIC